MAKIQLFSLNIGEKSKQVENAVLQISYDGREAILDIALKEPVETCSNEALRPDLLAISAALARAYESPSVISRDFLSADERSS